MAFDYSSDYDARMRFVVQAALEEDIGSGDVTACIFDDDTVHLSLMIAREWGVLSGSHAVAYVFKSLCPSATVHMMKEDGETFAPGDLLIEVEAPITALLAGERTALNFIQRLSGVATLTRKFVEELGSDSRIGVYDTRKTTPMMRSLQKMAVVHGGGYNHRFGLYDMAMIKNNHIDSLGGIAAVCESLRSHGFFEKGLDLCIEARNLQEAIQALYANADIIMLDNMPISMIRSTVAILEEQIKAKVLKRPQIEVSGNVNLENISLYKDLPIDRISIGMLTHSAPSVDIFMRLV